VLECMAARKAIVASDLPGIRDALDANAGDCLVAPGNAEQFAHRLLAFLQDNGMREALGEANGARIRAEFSVQRKAERYQHIIQESLSKTSLSAPAFVRATKKA
jgi:glycosyltransferase involved in cell wall biosynthesis